MNVQIPLLSIVFVAFHDFMGFNFNFTPPRNSIGRSLYLRSLPNNVLVTL